MSYIIIKLIKVFNGKKKLPVILLDGQEDVWEFNTLEDAEDMRLKFEVNSDSGHKYSIKKIG